MNESNQRKTGAVLSYAQMGLNIIVGLVYTPLMLRALGQSEYGLYNTVASTISTLGLLNLGFNSGYIRYYAKYKRENDSESIYRLNGLFILIFSVIGIISLICGLFISNNLNIIFSSGLSIEEYKTAKVLTIIMTINLSVSFPMSVFGNIISANEKFVFLKAMNMLKTILSPALILPLLLMGYKSIVMVSVSTVISIATDGCFLFYIVKTLKQKFWFDHFEKGLFKSLFIYTSFIAVNMFVDQINWNIDKLLLARYKGTVAVAVYSVGYSLHSYYHMFSTSIQGVFTPKIHNIINQYKDDRNTRNKAVTDLFIRVGRIQFYIMSLIASGFVFFGKEFIQIWAGEGYQEAYYVALLLMLPAMIPLIQNLGIEIQRALNKHQFRSVSYIIMAIINFVISIILCQRYGPIGCAVGTALSLIIANGIIMNVIYYRAIGIDVVLFWKNIFRISIGMLPPIIFFLIIKHYFQFDNIISLALGIIVYSLTYCLSFWKLSFNDEEKKLVVSAFVRIPFIKKKNKG